MPHTTKSSPQTKNSCNRALPTSNTHGCCAHRKYAWSHCRASRFHHTVRTGKKKRSLRSRYACLHGSHSSIRLRSERTARSPSPTPSRSEKTCEQKPHSHICAKSHMALSRFPKSPIYTVYYTLFRVYSALRYALTYTLYGVYTLQHPRHIIHHVIAFPFLDTAPPATAAVLTGPHRSS